MLFKLNTIAEGKLHVNSISLRSGLSDDVRFIYDIETAKNHPFGNKSWWADPTTSISDLSKTHKKDKIVKLIKQCDWGSIGLDWEQKEHKTTEIIFHDKQP